MDRRGLDSLTDAEKRVLRTVLVERNQKAVASVLGLKPETVKTHLRNAREKCGAISSYDLARVLAAHDDGPTPFQGIPRREVETREPEDGIPALPKRPRDDVSEVVGLREIGTTFDFEPPSLAPAEDRQFVPPARVGAMPRLLLAAALALVVMLAILLVFPLSESFQRLADLIAAHRIL